MEEKRKNKEKSHLMWHLNNTHILTGGNWEGRAGAPGEHGVLGAVSVFRETRHFPS